MIFVTTGSRAYPFDRLIKAVDEAAFQLKFPKEMVFAQIGISEYVPVNISYKRFLDKTIYDEKIRTCDILITHAAAGSLFKSLKMEKKIIAVPRLMEYGEHVDDHQVELAAKLDEMNMLFFLDDLALLPEKIITIQNHEFNVYSCRTEAVSDKIHSWIDHFTN